MSEVSEWKVKLAVSGAIAVKHPLTLSVEKGTHRFWTTVKLSNARSGIEAEVIVRASTYESANDSAVYFLGQMLDVLCLRLNTALYVSLFAPEFRPLASHVKRVVGEDEWLQAFGLGREYSHGRKTYSRSLTWYRKGLNSEDVIDKLIAFWSALERIGTKYARPNPRTEQGAINQICDCFDQLWGECSKWKVIPNDPSKLNEFHDYRNGISHGFMDIDIEQIREIGSKLPLLEQLTYAFLSDWERHGPA